MRYFIFLFAFFLSTTIAAQVAPSKESNYDIPDWSGIEQRILDLKKDRLLPGKGQDAPLVDSQKGSAQLKSTQCGIDTIRYVNSKATGYQAWEIDGSGYMGFGQYYDAPIAMDVEGVRIFAYAALGSFNADTVFSWIKIYDVGVDSLPVGGALDSVLVPVTKNFSGTLNDMAYEGIFNTPVGITGSGYFVSLEYIGVDTVTLFGNSVTFANGGGENLGFYNYQNVWYRNIDFILFDSDWMLEPIVSYVLDVEWTMSPNPLCLPILGVDSICTINTTLPIHKNRMYNQDYANPYYYWDWQDGLQDTFEQGCHFYASPGNYYITLTQTINGWTSMCTDVDTDTLTVSTLPDATFTWTVALGTAHYMFMGNENPGDDVLWVFGDGDSSTVYDADHDYGGSGTWVVTQYVTNSCGTDSSSQTLMFTGIDELAAVSFEMYPNPANDVVVISGSFEKATAHLYDATGRLVLTSGLQSGQNNIKLAGLKAGTYLIEVISEGKRGVQRLVID